jgi:hypothetical protein
MTYTPQPPLIVRQAVGGDYFVVTDARGVPVAQGTQAMCRLVAAGKRLYEEQGRLFDEH